MRPIHSGNSHQRRIWRRYLERNPLVAVELAHRRIMRAYAHAFMIVEPHAARFSPWHWFLGLFKGRPPKRKKPVAVEFEASSL